MLLNDVIDGGDIPLQWKETRVVLVYNLCVRRHSTIHKCLFELPCYPQFELEIHIIEV